MISVRLLHKIVTGLIVALGFLTFLYLRNGKASHSPARHW